MGRARGPQSPSSVAVWWARAEPARVVCLGYRNSHTTVPLVRLTERASRVCTGLLGAIRPSRPRARARRPARSRRSAPDWPAARRGPPAARPGPGPVGWPPNPRAPPGGRGSRSRSEQGADQVRRRRGRRSRPPPGRRRGESPARRRSRARPGGSRSSSWTIATGSRVPVSRDDGLRQRTERLRCRSAAWSGSPGRPRVRARSPIPRRPAASPSRRGAHASSPPTMRPATAPVPATRTYPSRCRGGRGEGHGEIGDQAGSDRRPAGRTAVEERLVGPGATGQADHRRHDPVGCVGPGLGQALLGDRADPLRRDLQTDAVGVPGRAGGDAQHLAGDGGHRDPGGRTADVRSEQEGRRGRSRHTSPRPRTAPAAQITVMLQFCATFGSDTA